MESNSHWRASVRSGDWMCGCGQSYRVAAVEGVVRMWPKNSPEGYRVDPVGAECVCGAPISRGTVLSALFGANVPGPTGRDVPGEPPPRLPLRGVSTSLQRVT